MSSETILNVAGLKVAAGDRTILDNVSFSVANSEIYGIYGESGAGKTMLGRALANWLPAGVAQTAGTITFADRDIRTKGSNRIVVGRDIAYIGAKPQSALDPTVPVGPQIVEKLMGVQPRLTRADAEKRVLDLLNEVRIASPNERFHDYPSKYSGGMMQRAMIVDAICADPAVLIADDIIRPLDVTVAAQIVSLLKDLCLKRKMAVVFLASSLPALRQVSERVGVLHNGRIVEEQPVEALLAAPKTDYTRIAITHVPRIWSTNEMPPDRARAGDKPLMEVRDVSRTYKVRKRGSFGQFNHVRAVQGVSFDIMPRENFGIVGESGCGKSTLTRLLTWLEKPDSGDIRLGGASLSAFSGKELLDKRREFQLLLQDPYNALPPRMTVGRMIEEGLRLRSVPKPEMRERVKAAMNAVGLPTGIYDDLPNALSTGERQRISIARALVLEPKLLILDETLSALDQGEQAKLIDLFAKLQETNDLTYVFISHDLAMVRKVCNRIGVMYFGKMVEIGDNRSIFFEPKHDYTKALLSAAPTLDEKPFDATELGFEPIQ
ncbi:ABC transporter ATP-binding protein [Ensifer soli]|uniref:ABC transporter ATP-binding protein n=1 Tax=Ciceribacter sp. sgz301302 TaxID=3342379 RepID=UPI0035BA25E0